MTAQGPISAGCAADFPTADADRWDDLAVAAGDFFLGSRWLRMAAGEPGVSTVYAWAHDGTGRLVAALPAWFSPSEGNSAYRASEVFRELDGGWRTSSASLGARHGYGNDILLHPSLGPAERAQAVSALLDLTTAWCHERSPAPPLAWYLHTPQAAALHDSGHASTPLLTDLAADIALPGSGFDDYLHALGHHRATAVRREIRAFAEAGLDVRQEPLDAVHEEAGPLLAQTMRRYGHAYTDSAGRASLLRQAEHLGDLAVAFTCRGAGGLLGFSLGFRWGSRLLMRVAGFDYARLPGAFEYFNTVYYAPAHYAYAHRMSALLVGTGSLGAKCARGATLSPRWTAVLRGADGTSGPTAAEAHAWTARVFRDAARQARKDLSGLEREARRHGLLA